MNIKVTLQAPPSLEFIKVPDMEGLHMASTQVTQEFWEAITGENPSKFKGPKNPVERVSYDDVQAFLTKLNGLPEDKGGPPEGMQYDLPTEREWEYCCKAGSDEDPTPLEDYAVFDANSPAPVGSKKPNPWGFYDMLGNVWEWCNGY